MYLCVLACSLQYVDYVGVSLLVLDYERLSRPVTTINIISGDHEQTDRH